ncbi:MAG TPA: right-handed parallel beta-helix repeat-containing protein, partial [Pseudobacteroides sp.]|uniref:fibronectin type III domain-containing protein n=1 Tax=Pseudobacteroides sp. TaxID=1968840 RepID=UPI002F9349F1
MEVKNRCIAILLVLLLLFQSIVLDNFWPANIKVVFAEQTQATELPSSTPIDTLTETPTVLQTNTPTTIINEVYQTPLPTDLLIPTELQLTNIPSITQQPTNAYTNTPTNTLKPTDLATPEVTATINPTSTPDLTSTTEIDTQPPSVPTGLFVFSKTDTKVNLSWTDSTDNFGIEQYIILRDNIEIGLAINNNFTDSGLENGKTYEYRIIAKDTAGNLSDASDAIYVTTNDIQAPSNPQNLRTSSRTSTTVEITWDSSIDNVGVTEYLVFDGSNQIGFTNGINSFSLTNLSPTTDYNITVKGKDAAGNISQASNILFLPAYPSVPENLIITPSENTINVTWDSSSGANSYEVLFDNNLININDISYTFNNLMPNTSHSIKIRSVNQAGCSDWSPEFTTYTLLNTPRNITTNTTDTTLTVNWSYVNDAASYDIEMDNQIITNITDTAYTFANLLPGTQHSYKIRANSSNNNSNWSEQSNVFTNLGTPVNVAMSVTTTTITLNWDNVVNAINYDVEVNGVVEKNVAMNNCVVSGLIPNTLYKVRIKAKNQDAFSQWSNEVSKTTLVSTNASGTINQNTTWTAANSPYILQGSITISAGVTLTVEPGVVIKSNNNRHTISVQGKLNAIGTAESPIVFTSMKDSAYGGSGVTGSSSDYWDGISISGTGELVGDYVKIRYGAAYSNNNSALNVSGKLTLTNSEIANSYCYGVYFNPTTDVSIKHSRIENSKQTGIYVYNTTTGAMTIENNTITGNGSSAIYVKSYGTGNLSVRGNTITSNTGYPISVPLGGLKSSIFGNIENNTYIGNTNGGVPYDSVVIEGTPTIDLTITSGMYYMSSSISVSTGKILTVEPGVVIKSNNNRHTISVQGKLNAIGTAE